jgi:hypothetical protein
MRARVSLLPFDLYAALSPAFAALAGRAIPRSPSTLTGAGLPGAGPRGRRLRLRAPAGVRRGVRARPRLHAAAAVARSGVFPAAHQGIGS